MALPVISTNKNLFFSTGLQMVLSVIYLLYIVVLFISNGSPGTKNNFPITTSARYHYTRQQKRVYLISHLKILTQEIKTISNKINPSRIKRI
jgi:hypothetical protein